MELNLLEKLIILGKNDLKAGFQISGIHLGYGIAGAALLEMTKDGTAEVKDKLISIKGDTSFSEPLLDEIAKTIQSRPEKNKLNYWMNQLYRKSTRYRWQLVEAMAEKGIFRIENKKFLGIFAYRSSYLIDSRIRKLLIEDLKAKINGSLIPTEDDLPLLGLVEACQMQRILFSDRRERKLASKKLKQLLEENPVAQTVDVSIRQVQAAILAAMVASTVATTATR